MTNVNLALFIDEEDVYLDQKLVETYLSWGYKAENLNHIKEWFKGAASIQNFFFTSFVHLDLRDKRDLKKFSELIKNNKSIFQDDWYGNGVIITLKHKMGAKGIIKLVQDSNGYFLDKRKVSEIKKELLQEIRLQKVFKDFISDYIGDDYTELLSVNNTLKSLNKEELNNLTFEKIYSFLPNSAGNVPPWEYVDEIFKLDINSFIEKLERSEFNKKPTPAPVLSTLLKNKMNLLYKYILAKNSGLKTNQEIANKLNLGSPYTLLTFSKIKYPISLSTAEYVCKLSDILDISVKGGSTLESYSLVKLTGTKIIIALKNNTVLENLC